MKIKLTHPDHPNHQTVVMDISAQDVELEGVYSGVGIPTDQGYIGICQRDAGVEVMLDGEIVFASYEDVGKLASIHEKVVTLHKILSDEGADGAILRLVGEINELVPGRIKAAAAPTDTKTEAGGG